MEKALWRLFLDYLASDIEAVLGGVTGVSVANYNCPGQIVITGWKESVDQAAEVLKEAGAKRVLPLNVSGPFHSPMLEEAGKKLAEVLEHVELHPMQIPYVTNVTAAYVRDIGQTKALLAQQVGIVRSLAAECGGDDCRRC